MNDVSGEDSSLHPDKIADAEFDEFMKTYHVSEPNPERTAKAIRYLISSRILIMASDNPGEGKSLRFFLARIAVRNASVLRLCEEALNSASHEGRIFLLDVLSSVGDATTKGFLKKRVIQQSYRHERAEMERALSFDLPRGLLNPLRGAIYSPHPRTRKSLCEMIRKLSVMVSRHVVHSRGSRRRKKSSMASVKRAKLA